ncbi:NAD(P)H-hydrate epimerase [Haloechinothrix sp. LS1_15]|uniref:NAD(P)H-hydrate epimerase n=1 Tax=Haloechinothrix sp. LS1_15 TaxID=2652248 RepID=UPI0029459AF0|nr:NAD(P)H-hydrate epimerase [Haloechinothrix sp. LS1_15]MDV6013613.1 NAD(P)H-hydrate epimerase [Haloechinothrix sp. LS1_15]
MRRPHVPCREVPAITAAQMREVDRIATSEFHIELKQLMENAGRSLAEIATETFRPCRVVVLCGPGGNGGGGLVAARHLINRGCNVSVVLATTMSDMALVAGYQLDILRQIGTPVIEPAEESLGRPWPTVPGSADLIIDALLGYSTKGDPRDGAARLIDWANAHPAPVLSLDSPSGLDVTTGAAGHPCVLATGTLTLALPKLGLLEAGEVGWLALADISIPAATYRGMGYEVGELFAAGPIVSLVGEPAAAHE